MDAVVWAFKPIKELNNELGFVTCDEQVAADLIKNKKAEDPKIGALLLSEIDYEAAPEEPKKAAPKAKAKKG